MESWTVEFFREWSSRMSLLSVARLRRRLLRAQHGGLRPGRPFLLNMKRPFQGVVKLRECGTDHVTFNEIVVDEIYKPVVSEIRAVESVIDLGANVGLASLYFAHHWPSCRILAVEPNPETYEILADNLAPLVRSGRCAALQAAAWDALAVLSAAPHQQPGGFNSYSLCEDARSSAATVKGLTVAEIIEYSGFRIVDLLKVDIEGAEIRLFRGDLRWLARVRNIAIEFHEDARRISRFDVITEGHGFRPCREDKHTVLISKGVQGQAVGQG